MSPYVHCLFKRGGYFADYGAGRFHLSIAANNIQTLNVKESKRRQRSKHNVMDRHTHVSGSCHELYKRNKCTQGQAVQLLLLSQGISMSLFKQSALSVWGICRLPISASPWQPLSIIFQKDSSASVFMFAVQCKRTQTLLNLLCTCHALVHLSLQPTRH